MWIVSASKYYEVRICINLKTISSIKRNFVREKLFYMTLLKVGIPIALQNMLGYFVNLADTIMLGKADNTGLLMSASSLANQPFFIMAMVCFGLSGAAAVLNTQYYGKGDFDAIRTVFAIILRASAVISVVFGAAVLLFPTQIMTLYSADPKTVATGAVYLSVMGWAYIFYAITSVMLLVLRSVAVTKISVWVSLASLITNVIGNWILIFGNLGFPAMGIKGAALATLFARAVEFIIVSVYVFKFEKKLSFRITDIFRRSRVLSKDLLKYGTPVLANEVLWSLAMTAQASILGHITYSTGDPVAANAICSTVQQISTLFVWGVAHAGAVLVGGAVGERDTEKVIIRSQTLRYISYIVGAPGVLFIIATRGIVLDIYDIEPETKQLANAMLIVTAIIVFFQSSASIHIVGTLRGAGDTKFCLYIEILSLWAVMLPLAFIAANILHLPVPIVLVFMRSDEIVKGIICHFRVKSGKFIKTVTRERGEDGSFKTVEV